MQQFAMQTSSSVPEAPTGLSVAERVGHDSDVNDHLQLFTSADAHKPDSLMEQQLAMSVRFLQNASKEASSMLSSLRKSQVKQRKATATSAARSLNHGVRQIAALRVVKPPAPIGVVPRMLDQLKRRCARLLITTPRGQDSKCVSLPSSQSVQRAPAAVAFNSKGVRQILEHWNNRSAFAALDQGLVDANQSGLTLNASAASDQCSKLTLLVWRLPAHPQPQPSESDRDLAPTTTPLLVQAWHVIPVTQLEAAEYHHIPVGLRESLVNDVLRNRISSSLTALMESLTSQELDVTRADFHTI